MPPSKSDILPSEGGITPMWALACGKYGIQGAFGALDDVFGGASEADRGARAQCAPPPPLGAPLYVVLLSRTASPSLAVIAVTAKIQIGPMTMVGQGVGEEVVWRRFYQQ